MRCAFIVALLLPLGLLSHEFAAAQPPKPGPPVQPPPAPVPIDKFVIRPSKPPPRALKYELIALTDFLPGDAGPHWKKAFGLRQGFPAWTEEEWTWIARELPLDKTPVQKLRKALEPFKEILATAELAARHERWDWPAPEKGIAAMGVNIDDIQPCREMANVLAFRLRLSLVEGKFEEGTHILRIGFMLAKHLGDGPTLLHSLVAVAIGSVMVGHLQDFVQIADAPNLYWALTVLPRPFIDLRKPLRFEKDRLFSAFPELRALDKAPLSAKQVEKLVDDLHALFERLGDSDNPTPEKPEFIAQLRKDYPDAKRILIKQGRKEQDLAAMPELQVVLIWYLDRYHFTRDELFKWVYSPYPEACEGLNRAMSQIPAKKTLADRFVSWTLPTGLNKVLSAQAKLDRRIAALRTIEALRLHAGTHGRLPAKLSELDVPIPNDVVTGKAFEYHVYGQDRERDTALLIAPHPPSEMPGVHNSFQWEVKLQRPRE